MKSDGINQNPWKTKAVKSVYDNSWIEVEHHDVITPNGTEGIYGKVKFKNYAIGIIPIDENLNTWIVGQYRYTINEYSWEIPMGGGPLKSDPLSSAKRELKEETGIIAQDWRQILRVHTSNCVTDEVGYIFVARGLKFGKTNFDDTEDLKIKKVPFVDLLSMIHRGEITDLMSVAGIQKLAKEMGF